MIYRSNLQCLDLSDRFRFTQSRVLGHSLGHDVISDWRDKAPDDPVFGLYTSCGFMTHDEAAILYHVASAAPGDWLDIGAHTGWSAAHLVQASCYVTAVEPMFWLPEWYARFASNLGFELSRGYVMPWAGRSDQLAKLLMGAAVTYRGVVIDGDHTAPWPYIDAVFARDRGAEVVVFHDAIGGPVWVSIKWLIEEGYKCKMYFTPHMLAVCWRGDLIMPVHTPDPTIDWNGIKTNHMREFFWDKVEHDAI